MEANELRIGNYVDTYNEDIHYGIEYVYNLSNMGINESFPGQYRAVFSNPINDDLLIKPIPLTEEWLLKFGFMKSKVSSQFDKEKLTIQIANELEYHKKGRVYFNSLAILEESIKYVHQLQNLYFALTGEELTFKSE
jgi:hypothetical protein